MTNEALAALARQYGFDETGLIPVSELEFSQEIRRICETGCRGYGKSWACPPAVGTVEECRARCGQYERMLLLSARFELEDSFDYEGMTAGMREFRNRVERFGGALRPLLPTFLLLSNEGCGRCAACTYPDAPCRQPQRMYHSIEGYGFNVSELARRAGVKYNNGPNTVTFFGALLFGDKNA